jgi:hypothetical protein
MYKNIVTKALQKNINIINNELIYLKDTNKNYQYYKEIDYLNIVKQSHLKVLYDIFPSYYYTIQ